MKRAGATRIAYRSQVRIDRPTERNMTWKGWTGLAIGETVLFLTSQGYCDVAIEGSGITVKFHQDELTVIGDPEPDKDKPQTHINRYR